MTPRHPVPHTISTVQNWILKTHLRIFHSGFKHVCISPKVSSLLRIPNTIIVELNVKKEDRAECKEYLR